MHQNLWPHFAASADGDKDAGIRPTFTNHKFHSYEVHSDWLQLLEEYGILGFILFLMPFFALSATLFLMVHKSGTKRRHERLQRGSPIRHATLLGSALALVCMAFHSLGDFNLQIPAIGWGLGSIIALGLAALPVPQSPKRRRRRSGSRNTNAAARASRTGKVDEQS